MDSKKSREGQWHRKLSSATYVKGLIQEVVPPTEEVEEPVLHLHQSLNESLDSSLSEGDAATDQVQAGGKMTRK